MAASMVSWRLSKACGSLHGLLFQNAEHAARIQCHLELSRGGKRTTKPAPWLPRKKVTSHLYDKELTKDNKDFLREVAVSKYVAAVDGESPLRDEPITRQEYTLRTMRSGVLAIKIGVVPQWTKDGHRFHTTMLQVLDNHVIRYTAPEEFRKSAGFKTKKWSRNNRYGSMVVGALSCDPFKYTKAYVNLFAEAGLPPKRKLTRFLVTPDAALQPGTPLNATHFRVGDYVDCQAKTIGHGFQGVVKRWGFKGGPASHGTTKWHRRPGGIGGGGDKSAVWKGKKMPGHMGMETRTLKGLRVWRINTKYNVLYVTGPSLPGPTHCYVRVTDSALWPRRMERLGEPPYMPTYLPDLDTPEGGLPEDILADNLFDFSDPSIVFQEEAVVSAKRK